MSLYSRVLGPTDLPPEGSAWESPACDFKSHADPTRFTEMAKDIAAFANGTGGVLLIKAAEAHGRLQRYLPMSRTEADVLRDAYHRAARDHCVPSPRVHPESISHQAGVILAVNIDGNPAQPVGVKATPERQHADDKFGPCFMFPVRVQDGTKFLSPDTLGLLVLPQIRTTTILLDTLSPMERSSMTIIWQTGPVGTARAIADLIDVDPLTLTFRLNVTSVGPPHEVRLPLEACRVLDDDHAHGVPRKRLHLNGSLGPAGQSGRLQWMPSYR